nr:hypothetical protein [Tanacetum cinerariifolium]
MSSITAQQTKLNLELFPKEKRLEIRKYNKRLNPRKMQREPTFQVVLDALALTPCPEIKETKDYKTYLGFATGVTPPKNARKFKKASPSKKDLNLNLVPVDEEPKSAKKKNKEEVEDDEEEEKEDEYVRTPSYYSPTDDEDKTNVDDNAKGDKDEEMDYTTNIPTTEAAIVSPMDVLVHHEVLSGTKSQSTSSGKSVKEEEPEFEVTDTNMPQDQEGNMGNEDEEPKRKVASKRDWFTTKQPQEPTDPEWNEGKTPQ